MKKTFLAIIIAASLAITGCEDRESTQKLQNAEKTIIQLESELKTAKEDLSKAQQNSALEVEIVKIFDKKEIIKHKVDPKEEFAIDESYVSSFISIPKTNMQWLNQLLINIVYDYNEEQGRKLKNPTEQDLVKNREEIYQGMVESVKEEPVLGYDENIQSTFLGQRNHIATFIMQFYSYSGGAHGMHYTNYINVDLNKQAVISLNDLIGSNKQAQLKEILWNNYSNTRLNEEGKYDGYTDPKDFRISNDFYFSPYGITFVYPPYELGAYAEGEIEVEAGWYEINQLLNPDYQRGEKDGFYPDVE